MKKILIGIPTIRSFDPFWKSFDIFLSNAREFYDVDVLVIANKRLGEAQNEIVDFFMPRDYDYLLFLDDDQWGHTVQMLNCLIEADVPVAVMKTYARQYPYICTLLRYAKQDGMSIPIENGVGYEEVDVAGFPMTLIERDVFEILEKPYFREVNFLGRDWNTDVDFCERLDKVGIKPIGCFQYCLNHDIVTQENVYRLRAEGSRDAAQMAMLRAFNTQQEMLKGV